MQTQNRLLDDMAKVIAGAAGGLAGLRQEIEARVKAMAAKARMEQERLAGRLAALEAQIGGQRAAPAPEGRPEPLP